MMGSAANQNYKGLKFLRHGSLRFSYLRKHILVDLVTVTSLYNYLYNYKGTHYNLTSATPQYLDLLRTVSKRLCEILGDLITVRPLVDQTMIGLITDYHTLHMQTGQKPINKHYSS